MAIFVKTEFIKKEYLSNTKIKKEMIRNHINWVKELKAVGINVKSGFLIDQDKKPGGGGFLIIECKTYHEAEKIIKSDPMIKSEIVDWKLHEWVDTLITNN